ncbi:MAG TPA: hypothetical protein V6D28_21745 [Leptolyngbyaceae cyanobacterium]
MDAALNKFPKIGSSVLSVLYREENAIFIMAVYQSKKRGSRQILSNLFTLKQMLEFLRQAIDRRYQVAHQVY